MQDFFPDRLLYHYLQGLFIFWPGIAFTRPQTGKYTDYRRVSIPLLKVFPYILFYYEIDPGIIQNDIIYFIYCTEFKFSHQPCAAFSF